MKKHEVTIIVPAVRELAECKLINAFAESAIRHQVYVQFVYLVNTRKALPQGSSEIMRFDTHEILHVTNDRYFGACEENIYRVQDFAGLFKRMVFCVGEHDIIDWDMLLEALLFFDARQLDAMGWNLLVKQMKTDGTYAQSLSIAPLQDKTLANDYMSLLLAGEVLSAPVAYAAMLSVYGPVDWAAYIGNHIFTRDVFMGLLQYKFAEHVYSLVYKEAVFFCSHKIRYGFFTKPIIHRVSEDFIKVKKGIHKWGWLEDHRTAHGGTPTFWIANILYLHELRDPALFNVIAHSFWLSQSWNDKEEGTYIRYFMFAHIFGWMKEAINHKLTGRSFYFPKETGSASLQDLRYVKLFFETLIATMDATPAVYADQRPEVKQHLLEALQFLNEYLESLGASDELLKLALNCFLQAQAYLPMEQLAALNTRAFQYYLQRL